MLLAMLELKYKQGGGGGMDFDKFTLTVCIGFIFGLRLLGASGFQSDSGQVKN